MFPIPSWAEKSTAWPIMLRASCQSLNTIDTPTSSLLPLIRFYIFLTVNIPRLRVRGSKFDVEAEFEKLFNIPLNPPPVRIRIPQLMRMTAA